MRPVSLGTQMRCLAVALLLVGCGGGSIDDGDGVDGGAGGPDGGMADCPPGIICPDVFPFHDDNDSTTGTRDFDGYSCSPGTDESGPEIIYRVVMDQPGFLSAAVADDAPMVDIDLHILGSLDDQDCIARGHFDVGAHLPAGTYYIVADTWVSDTEGELAGPYALDIGYIVPNVGDCSMTTDVVDRIAGAPLTLPTTGPMVLEAHLVSEEDGFPMGVWPSDIWDGIPEHYQTSFGITGFVMSRSQSWAPQESSEFGQGATGQPLPGLDESWYINMYWSNRPARGTRMIVSLPGGGPTIVAAAGYETGPGNPDNIGGVTEEIHFYLGTGHLDDMRIGFAADQSLPLGPIECQ
jgi:hypothetical protein